MADYVLTQYTGKEIEEELLQIEVLKAEIEELKKRLQEKLGEVPAATHSSYGGVKISGTITSSNPSGAYGTINMANGIIYVPMASFSYDGTSTAGVISGEDYSKMTYAYRVAVRLVADPQGDPPLRVRREKDNSISIGLWQDGNTFKGGAIPLASENEAGLLPQWYTPYLDALYDKFSTDEFRAKLDDLNNISSVAVRQHGSGLVLPIGLVVSSLGFKPNITTGIANGNGGAYASLPTFVEGTGFYIAHNSKNYSSWENFSNLLDSSFYEVDEAKRHLFYQPETGKMFSFDGNKLKEVSSQSSSGGGTDVSNLEERVSLLELNINDIKSLLTITN